jgi:hypothetical protein
VTVYQHVVTLPDGTTIEHSNGDKEGYLVFEVGHAGALLVYRCRQTPFDIVSTLVSAYAPGEWASYDRLAVE